MPNRPVNVAELIETNSGTLAIAEGRTRGGSRDLASRPTRRGRARSACQAWLVAVVDLAFSGFVISPLMAGTDRLLFALPGGILLCSPCERPLPGQLDYPLAWS
jgi:hypothetical protein